MALLGRWPEEHMDYSMPKVMISVSERVTYSREVEMTEAEWLEWNRKIAQRGQAGADAVRELADKYIRRPDDFADADDLELEDLSVELGR